MKLDEIEKIMKLFEKSSIGSMDIEVDGMKIKLNKNSLESQVNNNIVSQNAHKETLENTNLLISSNDDYVVAPLVGTYHERPQANGTPFVKKGDRVKKGQKLCIIEAMKVMNEVYATRDGIIKEILCKENEMVEFGQNLFVIGDENV